MSPISRSGPIEVLLIEDNPHDAELTIRTLKQAKIRNTVHVAADGEAALDYLHKRGTHATASTPDLILLDLSLPKKDGRLLLEEIKSDESLRRIPVIVLTGSATDSDVALSYQLHANAYITKPVDPLAFLAAIDAVELFWLEIVRLP